MAKRLGKLQTFLQEQKLDALLIKSKTMKKYMDTLTGSGCQILLMNPSVPRSGQSQSKVSG